MHLFDGGETSGFDVESHLLVGITERHTFGGKTIDLFDREHQVVARVVEDVLVDSDVLHHERHHTQNVLQFVERGKEDLLDDLQIAEVTRGEIVSDHHNLLGHTLQFVTLGAREFEDIGVLLVGHDGRAGGEGIVQLDEAEVLAREHASIEGKFGNGAGNAAQSLRDDAFGLATSHLRIDDVVGHRVEAQQVSCHLATQRETRPVAGSRTKGVAVDYTIGALQHLQVIDEALSIGAEPQAKTGGHSHLQVGITRHKDVAIAFGLRLQHIEELSDGLDDCLDLVAHIELEVDEHLVVAASTRMDLLADIAQAAREDEFHLAMDVLNAFFDDETAFEGIAVNLLHLTKQDVEFIAGEQADAFEHSDVRHGAKHVVGGEIEVHLAVATDGIAFDVLIDLDGFFPKFHSKDKLIGNLGEHLGKLIGDAIELLANHRLEEEGDIDIDGDAATCLVGRLGEELNPEGNVNGALVGLELDALHGFLTIDDAETDLHTINLEEGGVARERQVAQGNLTAALLGDLCLEGFFHFGGHVVLHSLELRQVADAVPNLVL